MNSDETIEALRERRKNELRFGWIADAATAIENIVEQAGENDRAEAVLSEVE